MFKLFNKGNRKAELAAAIAANGSVVDVRSPGEYARGHIEGSVNIPVGAIKQHLAEIKAMSQPVITCCASGIRSGKAASILKKEAIEAVNGGGWSQLDYQLKNKAGAI